MATINNDSNLAYLLSLGFDIDLCKQALSLNSNIERATEWILNPNHPPVLNLGLDLSVPFSSNSELPSTSTTTAQDSQREEEAEAEKLFQKHKFEKIAKELKHEKQMEKEARKQALLDINADREKRKQKLTVASASMDNTFKKEEELTEQQRIQLEIRKQKKLDQEAKQRVLQNIKDDMLDKKKKVTAKPTESGAVAEPSSSTATKVPSTTSACLDAFIQFKFTNGTTLRQKFPSSAKVRDLLEFVANKNKETESGVAIENISLSSTFPKKMFTVEHEGLDMAEAGFLPNVSLNVTVAKPTEDVVMTQQPPLTEFEHSEEEGHMQTDEEELALDMGGYHEDDEMRPRHIMNVFSQRSWTVQGEGHTLTGSGPDINVVDNNSTEARQEEPAEDRRSHFLSAIETRSSSNQQTLNHINKAQHRVLKRNVKSLTDLCCMSVSGLLTQHTQSTALHLKNLKNIAPDIADALIKYLIQNGKLNPFTLKKLLNHCYLQKIALDSYPYCTDSLIEDLSKSNSSISITKLSLRGCDVITDNGIRSLERLRILRYLDLNNCKLTDKGLKSLENLSNLHHLNLSKTKITDKGLISMINNAQFKSNIEVLILDSCTRISSSNILITIINELTNLVQLSLAHTDIPLQSLTGTVINKHTKLRILDINHTLLNDENLIQVVCHFKQLVELKLTGCENITTRGLSFLPRELKQLKDIQFPNREHELDGVLSKFKDLSLENLDLTGYSNVTDEGVQYIAQMHQLRSLSLDGTKVTNKGVALLKDLFELETLYLDRTLVTRDGLQSLSGLSKLSTLSLCHTNIRNNALRLLGDFEQTNFTKNLRTLNLAQCRHISNKGVRELSGMINLTNLSLDHTSVSKDCLQYLKDLEHLKSVRLQGIESEQAENSDLSDITESEGDE